MSPIVLDAVLSSVQGYQVDTTILPDGEQHKSLDVLNRIFDGLLTARHNRTTTLIALGGGVVGEMAGFPASCYQRGVVFLLILTTLFALLDSSVGCISVDDYHQ